jgi:hypothetical protein
MTEKCKSYKMQIDALYVEIMNLESALKKERSNSARMEEKPFGLVAEEGASRFSSRGGSVLSRGQRYGAIRSSRGEEKLKTSLFKSHHLRMQPIRTEHIESNKELMLEDLSFPKEECQSQSELKKKLQETEQRLKDAEDKLMKMQN